MHIYVNKLLKSRLPKRQPINRRHFRRDTGSNASSDYQCVVALVSYNLYTEIKAFIINETMPFSTGSQ